MGEQSEISAHELPHAPSISLEDIARVLETTIEVVRRVADSLNLPPEGPFEMKDFVRINRMLMTVRERYQTRLPKRS